MSNKEPRISFQDRVVYFMGNVDSTLTTMNNRLTKIEEKMGNTCPAHESLVQMIATQKDTNILQRDTNVKTNEWQVRQDTGIRDLQEQSRIIEYKLSNKDLAKISTIVISVTTVIMYVLERLLR